MSAGIPIGRRSFLRMAGSSLCLPHAIGPVFAQGTGDLKGTRPATPHGVAAGDVGAGRAVVWSAADRSARMFVEYATTESFTDPRRVRGPAALETSGFTCRTVLTDLPAGQRIFYRVLFQDLSDLRSWSDPVVGTFTTPRRRPHVT